MLDKIKNKLLSMIEPKQQKKVLVQSNPMAWLKEIDIDSVIDIGANEGQFLEKALELYPDKKIFCFEPLSAVVKILKDKFGQINNVTIIENAIGDKNKTEPMNHCEFSPSSSILKMENLHKEAFPFTNNSTIEEVTMRRLDDVTEIHNACKKPFIKVDTQGYELNVINGGIETFKRAPMVMIEVSYKILYKNQPLFDDIYKKLTEMGFVYIGNVEQLLDPRTQQPLQADAIFKNTKYHAI